MQHHSKSPAVARQTALLLTLTAALGGLTGPGLFAQDIAAFTPADTSSPRATLRSFIEASNAFYQAMKKDPRLDRSSSVRLPTVQRILDCLDDSFLPEFEREEAAGEAAICIKEILDRVELPPWEEIPDDEQVGDEERPRWRIPGTRLTIAAVEEGPRRHEFLFTAASVRRSFQYFRDVQAVPYRTSGPPVSPRFHLWYVTAPGRPVVASIVNRLPDWWREQSAGMAHWKWAGLLLACVVAVLLIGVNYRLGSRLSIQCRQRPVLYFLTILFPVLNLLIALAFQNVARDYVTLRGYPLYVVSFIVNLYALLARVMIVFGLSGRISALIIANPAINPRGLDAQFIRIVARLISFIVALVVFLEGGNYLGFPITTLVASAGVGGLAIALAAQDTLRNVFGTVMLLMDKPFRVGERIIFEQYDGVVEEIGLRSTRLRLLTGHQASIPNDHLARTDIENVGRRPHIRRVADIHIPLDTPREKIEPALAAIRKALENHEGMEEDYPPRVNFLDFGAESFIIRIFYWYNPPDYWKYLEFSEKVNLDVFRALDEQGIQLAAPLRVLRDE